MPERHLLDILKNVQYWTQYHKNLVRLRAPVLNFRIRPVCSCKCMIQIVLCALCQHFTRIINRPLPEGLAELAKENLPWVSHNSFARFSPSTPNLITKQLV